MIIRQIIDLNVSNRCMFLVGICDTHTSLHVGEKVVIILHAYFLMANDESVLFEVFHWQDP